jgi:hypothetical protein
MVKGKEGGVGLTIYGRGASGGNERNSELPLGSSDFRGGVVAA